MALESSFLSPSCTTLCLMPPLAGCSRQRSLNPCARHAAMQAGCSLGLSSNPDLMLTNSVTLGESNSLELQLLTCKMGDLIQAHIRG